MVDVVIIGGGPAGASAAIFTARAGLATVVIDADKGKTRAAMLYNHLGFPAGITGPDLVDRGRDQAERSGATWVEATATGLTGAAGAFQVTTEDGTVFDAASVIVASGVALSFAEAAGVALQPATEPRVASIAVVDAEGRTSIPGVWAAGIIAGASAHTIVTAGHGAAVAINLVSQARGARYIDHDRMPANDA
jgi:thioredoxin reductase